MCSYQKARQKWREGYAVHRAEQRAAGQAVPPFGGARGGVRPAAAPFNPEEAKNAGLLVEVPRRGAHEQIYVLNGKKYKDGYELKVAGVRSVQELKDPPFADVQHFLAAASGGKTLEQERMLMDAAGVTAPRSLAQALVALG
jgi:hypothetical protein